MPDPDTPEDSPVQLPRNLHRGRTDIVWIGRFFATVGPQVYSTRGLLKEAEADSFRLIAQSEETTSWGPFCSAYATSAGAAWYVDELCAPKKLASVAPDALRVLAPHFATDGKAVFHDGNRIASAKVDSFRVLTWCYSVDAQSCYHFQHKIRGADPATFRPVGEGLPDRNLYVAVDGSGAYYYARKIPEAGPEVKVLRGDRDRAVGITDGALEWSLHDLAEVLRQTRPKPRAVLFPEEASNVRHLEALFAGLEERLSFFLMLCSVRSIEAFEKLTRGTVGEKAILRAIELLNERAPSPLAQVDATSIRITPVGLATYRQFGGAVDAVANVLGTMKPA